MGLFSWQNSVVLKISSCFVPGVANSSMIPAHKEYTPVLWTIFLAWKVFFNIQYTRIIIRFSKWVVWVVRLNEHILIYQFCLFNLFGQVNLIILSPSKLFFRIVKLTWPKRLNWQNCEIVILSDIPRLLTEMIFWFWFDQIDSCTHSDEG